MHFLSDTGLRSCGWFNFGHNGSYDQYTVDTSFGNYNADVFVDLPGPEMLHLDDTLIYPPDYISICTYDIETTSVDGKFPDPAIEGNKIT